MKKLSELMQEYPRLTCFLAIILGNVGTYFFPVAEILFGVFIGSFTVLPYYLKILAEARNPDTIVVNLKDGSVQQSDNFDPVIAIDIMLLGEESIKTVTLQAETLSEALAVVRQTKAAAESADGGKPVDPLDIN